MKRKFEIGDIVRWRKDAFMSSGSPGLASRAREIHGNGMVVKNGTHPKSPEFIMVFWFRIGHTWDWVMHDDLELVQVANTNETIETEVQNR